MPSPSTPRVLRFIAHLGRLAGVLAMLFAMLFGGLSGVHAEPVGEVTSVAAAVVAAVPTDSTAPSPDRGADLVGICLVALACTVMIVAVWSFRRSGTSQSPPAFQLRARPVPPLDLQVSIAPSLVALSVSRT